MTDWIRCFLCGHRGVPYTDIDGSECNACGHREFDWIEADDPDRTEATAREVGATASDYQAPSHRKSRPPALEVENNVRKRA